ncbi:MAG: 1-acyl-sn-glycerol-3-phosphate acyltransferase [Alphaproteobacteria bacterium]|nr:1-acyl-sn-glycerol-3-phosphate acyltransferase [Alphaproteobacteria bacterium]MBQ8631478.1 1-acyl-sn-glycerol-3-phosphate acyltransferase [Alphaproteobacteria bacterium]
MLFIRSLIFNICCYGLILFGAVISLFLAPFPQKLSIKFWNGIMQPLSRKLLKIICGLDIEVRGEKYVSQSGVIYACKHQSAMETYYLTTIIKTGVFILKRELHFIPFFGWASHFYGMIPVNRSAGSAAMKNMLKESKKRVAKGRPIMIFPEGTRTKPETTTQYKPGVAFLYQNLGLPVVPVALNTGLFWEKASFMRYPGKVIIEFMPPIAPGLDKKEFMDTLKQKIENKCEELNQEAFKKYPYTLDLLQKYKKAK